MTMADDNIIDNDGSDDRTEDYNVFISLFLYYQLIPK
jgi:hypothetical protein